MILVYTWPAIVIMVIIGMWLGNHGDDNDSMYY